MAKGEFFSFGDEDIEATFGDSWAEADAPERTGAIALVDPPDRVEPDEDLDAAHAGTRAQRSRGDSEMSSLEKRGPSPLRVHSAVVLALVVTAALLVHLLLGATGGDRGAAAPRAGTDSAGARAAGARSLVAARARSRTAKLKRDRAAERRRARGRRELSRRRATKRRRSRAAEIRRRTHRGQVAADTSPPSAPAPAPAPAYLAPEPQATPAPATSTPAPVPPPGTERHLQDGSSSPEFGL